MKPKKPQHSTHHRAVYRSSIPRSACEVVTSFHPDGTKETAEYFVGGQKVGIRYFYVSGQIEFEWALQGDGSRHGYEYEFATNGQMTFKSRYVNGREHGTARQWNARGQLLITYRKRHGVGLDLWCDNLSGTLSEELYCPADGELGVERRWQNERSVSREAFFRNAYGWHGIEREWNAAGKLSRGFPRYYVRGDRVTKRQYLRTCETDPTLTLFHEAENRPYRKLSPSYVAQRDLLRKHKRSV